MYFMNVFRRALGTASVLGSRCVLMRKLAVAPRHVYGSNEDVSAHYDILNSPIVPDLPSSWFTARLR